jgi:peptidoglycan/LPS O-acetylase OafA/YrhL
VLELSHPGAQLNAPHYRPDIDGLRGVAILAVIGFHYLPHVFPGGFIGVDVFFVISGYLITGILLSTKNISLLVAISDFYIRRVKRLLPALTITLALALSLGFVFLLPSEFRELCKNVVAAATFTTNFVLMNDLNAGYFADISINNQLVHLWSLSIEEQFYLVWPVLLCFTPKNFLLASVTALLTSFVVFDFFNVFGNVFDRYYFPGTRFWEIFAGAWLAVVLSKGPLKLLRPLLENSRLAHFAKISGLLLIIAAIFIVKSGERWPGPKALLPVIATMAILAFETRGRLITTIFCNRALIELGLISYPLYLYHWMFLSFTTQAYSGTPPNLVKLGALTVSMVLAIITYRLVEIPIRRNSLDRRQFWLLPISLASLCILGLYGYSTRGLDWRFKDEQAFNDVQASSDFVRITQECLQTYGHAFVEGILPKRDFCLSTGSKEEGPVLLIGDSHASMLYLGFVDLGVQNIVHLGRGSCPPILDLDPNVTWYRCQPTVNGIIEYLRNSNASLVVLTGVFQRYFDGTYETHLTKDELDSSVHKWFEALGNSKKRILVVLDNPSLPFEPKHCMRRPIDLNQRLDCSFDRSAYDKRAEPYKQLFKKAAASYANVALLDASQFFCDDSRCHATNQDGLLYTSDDNHLSLRGARIVDQKIVSLYPSLFVLSKTRP